ncbi:MULTISPECIES: hypothetical protein [Prochlorococcus]|uniref:Uncharacterized protein n=1 Tax=Prochlorococcus marinus (strain SARG / CCMP1375 / SS120) TaxID=167539 RepID=Q7VAF2_PROMA|nr:MULTISPECIES: hypothetical protein [Prochlorococcus]AAQ00555.1 Predicted protein [Prochlorococcus marinus subsp. marinus str. CCMP1375]KGG10959.1 hypothetical protein EV04_1923 [Prochlorococcus marinus str. LG]KGG19950.1 hypothetical protein EV08_1182 [Prochlorococcus marinus str. SS2]KGG24208.1 hypothetical protein EV09_0815 [Prochlorococcus marinus str. SS35]KGG31535.1 hypothetical protein EV10_1628 [Prochlorococcus marinus str. SS51]
MGKSLRFVALAVLLSIIQFTPMSAMACVEGLSWGMDLANVESHLGVSLSPVREGVSNDLFEVKDFQMSGLPVNSLLVRVPEKYGLKQLAYEMDYENMTEVLAGLRHRFGPPVGASVDIDGRSPQQQWIWHTGEDVVTAVKSEQRPFIISYRPSRLDPSFL